MKETIKTLDKPILKAQKQVVYTITADQNMIGALYLLLHEVNAERACKMANHNWNDNQQRTFKRDFKDLRSMIMDIFEEEFEG